MHYFDVHVFGQPPSFQVQKGAAEISETETKFVDAAKYKVDFILRGDRFH